MQYIFYKRHLQHPTVSSVLVCSVILEYCQHFKSFHMLSITLKCSYYIVNYKSTSVAPLRALEAHNCVKQLYGHSIPFM